MRGNSPSSKAIVAACIIAITSPRSPAGQVGFTVGNHFTASSTNQSGFIPPDSDGAIGPDQFVELINGSYTVFDRGGKALLRTSLDQFCAMRG